MAKVRKNGKENARRASVAARQEARNSRSAVEQLELLDQRLGAGIGAEKERARLAKLI